MAVIVCEPGASVPVEQRACCDASAIALQPLTTLPSERNCTVPDGMPVVPPTIAMNVTVCVLSELGVDEVSVTVVGTCTMMSADTLEGP